MKNLPKIIFFASLSLLACLLVAVAVLPDSPKIGGTDPEKVYYDVVGTADSPATLSTLYASNTKSLFFTDIQSLHLDMSFTPTTTDEYVLIKVEQSNDNGETFFPLSTKTVGATEIGLNISNATDGVPIIFPSTKDTVTGTEYSGSIDFDIIGDIVKISAKSSTTSGQFYLRAIGSNQQ